MKIRISVPIILSILLSSLGAAAGLAVEPSVLDSPELAVVYDAGLEQTAQQIPPVYAGIRQELETLFGWPVQFRPTLVLIGDPKRFLQLAGHPLVVAYALPPKNIMVINNTQMTTSPFTLQATIKHELCHLLLHDHIKSDQLPRWLDEGICQWASDGLADIIMDSRRSLLPAAVLSGQYFDLAELEHRFPQEKNGLILAYEQSKSVVEYMSREFGPQGILDLLELLRQGHPLQSAVEMRFALSWNQFENQWRNHLKTHVNWFTYVSRHLYEILFVSAALLTILAYIRRVFKKRAYARDDEDLDGF